MHENPEIPDEPTAPVLPPWQQQFIAAFLDVLRNRPIITEAVDAGCAAAGRGISRRTAYEWRQKDEAFRNAWDDALETGWDKAEGAAYTRAVDGISQPIVNKQGDVVGEKVEYSDRLLELLLKGNRARTYRETHKVEVEHTVSPQMLDVLVDVRRRRMISRVREIAGGEVQVLPASQCEV